MAIGARPIRWPPITVEIPTTSPSAVAAPAYATWLGHARANHAALEAETAPIAGKALRDLRRSARAEVLVQAAAYTRQQGVAVPAAGADLVLAAGADLVLATGHQPVLAHPGIWIKYLAACRLVPEGGVGLNLIVDSDALGEVAAEVPRLDGRLRRARVTLAEAAPEVPAELVAAPTPQQWRAFVQAVDDHLRTLEDPQAAAGWVRARRLPPPREDGGLPGAVTALRRALEGPRPYLDLPVSHMARTAAFRHFALAILQEAGRFAEVHNTCLASYRKHYGIRTAAQPFPDLEVAGPRVEAPFWVVADGRRWPLMVDTQAGRLWAAGREVGPLPDDPDDEAFAAVPMRPRALTLTAFARLLVADLFVHGIGGARYDVATDAIIRGFFGVEPPAYAVVTATLFLPLASEMASAYETASADQRQRLHRLLLDLQHNPDRFLPSEPGPHQALVAEKWALIRALEGASGLTRRQRRTATQRIREINAVLQVTVADRVAEARASLDALDHRQQEEDAAVFRGYPFLLFPVEQADALVDLLAREAGAGAGAPPPAAGQDAR